MNKIYPWLSARLHNSTASALELLQSCTKLSIWNNTFAWPRWVWPTEHWWHINALVNWVIIDSENGLLPGHHQAITWTNVYLWQIWIIGVKLNQWNLNQNSTIFIQENTFENVCHSGLNKLTHLALYASVIWVIIVSGNGLLTIRCQVITSTNDGF